MKTLKQIDYQNVVILSLYWKKKQWICVWEINTNVYERFVKHIKQKCIEGTY